MPNTASEFWSLIQLILYISFTFSDCWVRPSGFWLFSACCPVYEVPPSRTWRLPPPPWVRPASWFVRLGTPLMRYIQRDLHKKKNHLRTKLTSSWHHSSYYKSYGLIKYKKTNEQNHMWAHGITCDVLAHGRHGFELFPWCNVGSICEFLCENYRITCKTYGNTHETHVNPHVQPKLPAM